MFSAKPIKPTFKSYLPPVQTEKPIDPPIKKVEPQLLLGEIVVNEVNFVRKCISNENGHDDLWGKLICTNFKVSFIPQEVSGKPSTHLSHLLLGEHDIPLTCLDQVVTVNDTRGKKKVLGSNQKLKFNPTELILYCKDLRIIRFCFDEAGPESAKKVCLAIAHYSHPADIHLLFGFEYQGRRYHEEKETEINGSIPRVGQQTVVFDRPSDWDREIKRTGATEWRVCAINECYSISQSLPEYIVVPASLADQDLRQLAVYFSDSRIPLWCWNHPNGSALVRMSNIADPIQQKKIERILNAITKSHPHHSEVIRVDLDKGLPNIQDIQSAFSKIRQICVIDPFEESEERWFSCIENSRWLEYVRAFLKQSAEIVYLMEGKSFSVLISEEEDRDLNCVVSSLVQLMLDPQYRTISGFQSLVQKEWVMAGHRFLDRCNHLKKNDKEECPLFLLFLDCVWQMINQYPAAFEFTETYLTVLTDSMWIPLFSTFLFNSCLQRTRHLLDFAKTKAIPPGEEQSVYFPPVWEWSQQFTAKEQTLFNNPMYVGKRAVCVHNGEVKTFRRTKKVYSASVKGILMSVANGLKDGEGTFGRRASFMSELKPEFSPVKDVVESPSELYFRDWFSRTVDLQGLLLPMILPSHIALWKLFFLRWVPEACIPKGGSITTYHKLCQLVDEIEMLQCKLRQYKGPSPGVTPEPSLSKPHSEQRRMYFNAGSSDEPHSLPDFLTSSFPFTPVGNLCRRSTLGTPISKFLNGAKIWLSTETLNDTV
ncbi:myotubularin-related protein 10 [Periophthalmus magnuspinnatus]|uniref:myotubularin-related protein 10 n=1 Tax=Periophthalmus magnuspinnatus TaxID=409849 RepID=UPI00145A08D2|nr:myotubularin-related protein 10 [Periophthalmus magnuspinnatus]